MESAGANRARLHSRELLSLGRIMRFWNCQLNELPLRERESQFSFVFWLVDFYQTIVGKKKRACCEKNQNRANKIQKKGSLSYSLEFWLMRYGHCDYWFTTALDSWHIRFKWEFNTLRPLSYNIQWHTACKPRKVTSSQWASERER